MIANRDFDYFEDLQKYVAQLGDRFISIETLEKKKVWRVWHYTGYSGTRDWDSAGTLNSEEEKDG